jgi:hypothetical protein
MAPTEVGKTLQIDPRQNVSGRRRDLSLAGSDQRHCQRSVRLRLYVAALGLPSHVRLYLARFWGLSDPSLSTEGRSSLKQKIDVVKELKMLGRENGSRPGKLGCGMSSWVESHYELQIANLVQLQKRLQFGKPSMWWTSHEGTRMPHPLCLASRRRNGTTKKNPTTRLDLASKSCMVSILFTGLTRDVTIA